jgi:hypothetical protein
LYIKLSIIERVLSKTFLGVGLGMRLKEIVQASQQLQKYQETDRQVDTTDTIFSETEGPKKIKLEDVWKDVIHWNRIDENERA